MNIYLAMPSMNKNCQKIRQICSFHTLGAVGFTASAVHMARNSLHAWNERTVNIHMHYTSAN